MTGNRSWSWRHALLKSDLPATTRHVLLTISCFMNDVGGGCYPTHKHIGAGKGTVGEQNAVQAAKGAAKQDRNHKAWLEAA